MKILLVSLLALIGTAFSLAAAEPVTLNFSAAIASPQRVEDGWRWYYRRSTNSWIRYVTNIVDNVPVVTDNGDPPTFTTFCRSHIQNTFDAHGYQWYNGYLSEQADRAKAQLVRKSIEDLSNENLELLFRISAALATNTVAASNAIMSVAP